MTAAKTFAQFRAEQPELFAKLELVIQLQAFASRWEYQMIEALKLWSDDDWSEGAADDFHEYVDALTARQSWA